MQFELPAWIGWISLVAYGLEIFGMGGIFMKAKKPFWYACIPVLQYFKLAKLAGKSPRWWLYFILPQVAMFVFKAAFEQLQSGLTVGVAIFISVSWLLLLFFPFKFLILFLQIHLSAKFNKWVWFALGMTIFPFIFYNILFIDKSKFDAKKDYGR